MQFTKKSPCNNCPYRKDAPLAHWSVEEFRDLLASEETQFGKVYGCHKNDDSVCVGWLMNQDENRFPSISLRMALSRHGIDRKYLDNLTCRSDRYSSIAQMCEANYPEHFKTIQQS